MLFCPWSLHYLGEDIKYAAVPLMDFHHMVELRISSHIIHNIVGVYCILCHNAWIFGKAAQAHTVFTFSKAENNGNYNYNMQLFKTNLNKVKSIESWNIILSLVLFLRETLLQFNLFVKEKNNFSSTIILQTQGKYII